MWKKDILLYGPWKAEDVEIIFDNTLIKNSEKANVYINDTWKLYCEKNKKHYNSRLLRLNSWNNNNGVLELNNGITYYSDYIGTRNSIFKEKFPDGNRANPIGMTVIPITIDRNVVITKRSSKMEQNPNKLYFCGGYAEPRTNKNNKVNLMEESLREVNEELGVSQFIYFNFIGLAYDPVYCHPELFSTVILNVTKDKLIELWQTSKDKDEADCLLFQSLESIHKEGFNRFKLEATWSYQIGAELFNKKVIEDIFIQM